MEPKTGFSVPVTNKRTGAPEPNIGTLLYLIFLGIVATSTVVGFFGLGFSLLARSSEKMVVGAGYGVEVEAGSPDLVVSPKKDAVPSKVLTEPTNPASSFSNLASATQPSSEARAVLPPANTEMAWSSLPTSAADSVAANAMLRGWRSKSDEPTPTTPTGTHARRAGISRHHHYGIRKDWARLSAPTAIGRPTPAVSAPEIAWRWIVQSATNIVAALSLPPSRQAPVLKQRQYSYQ
jgi:hypothetical protein